MLSPSTIKRQNRERAERAARENLEPFVYFEPAEVAEHNGFPFPHIGDHRPEGWELVDVHFVDATGLGTEREPALTVSTFADIVRRRIRESDRTVGWAVIEAGQFQVRVGEFQRVS